MSDVTHRRSLYLVHRDLSELPPLPALPAGYRLRTWQAGDETKVPPVLGDAFFGDPTVAAYETFRRYLEERGAFIPENVFVIEAASGQVVGTTTARFVSAQVGRLHRVGVQRKHQGRGLGTTLVLKALHHLAERDVHTVYVGTEDDKLAALSVYLHAGFRPVLDRADLYEGWRWSPPDDLGAAWAQVYAKLAAYQAARS
jgi:mycothiol synthase